MNCVSFVVLHYGDISITDKCICSILKMEQQEYIKIVLVDNDIKKIWKERQKLQDKYKKFSNIYVIQVKNNGGFSYANNVGYKFSRDNLKASFVVILNNDIEFVQRDFVRKLYCIYEKYPCHIMNPDIIKRYNGEHQSPMDVRLRTKKEALYTIKMNRLALRFYPIVYPLLFMQYKRMENKKRTIVSCSSVIENIVPLGACLIFTPDFLKLEKKAFDPETKFYYEEYILGLRCQKCNYKISYIPFLHVIHDSGKATKRTVKNEYNRIHFIMEQTLESCLIYLKYLEEK